MKHSLKILVALSVLNAGYECVAESKRQVQVNFVNLAFLNHISMPVADVEKANIAAKPGDYSNLTKTTELGGKAKVTFEFGDNFNQGAPPSGPALSTHLTFSPNSNAEVLKGCLALANTLFMSPTNSVVFRATGDQVGTDMNTVKTKEGGLVQTVNLLLTSCNLIHTTNFNAFSR